MNKRITLISIFDSPYLQKINDLVYIDNEYLCKVPFGLGIDN